MKSSPKLAARPRHWLQIDESCKRRSPNGLSQTSCAQTNPADVVAFVFSFFYLGQGGQGKARWGRAGGRPPAWWGPGGALEGPEAVAMGPYSGPSRVVQNRITKNRRKIVS